MREINSIRKPQSVIVSCTSPRNGSSNKSLFSKIHLEKALSFNITNFGEDAPATCTCRSNLALILWVIGGEKNLLEAKSYFEKVMISYTANFGLNSPTVALPCYNLGAILVYIGKKTELPKANGKSVLPL